MHCARHRVCLERRVNSIRSDVQEKTQSPPGVFLDFFNLYDKLVEFGHAGALLPITSFGHSLMHSVMDGVAQQGLLGIPLGMLDLTAAGITSAIYFAFLAALIFKPKL